MVCLLMLAATTAGLVLFASGARAEEGVNRIRILTPGPPLPETGGLGEHGKFAVDLFPDLVK